MTAPTSEDAQLPEHSPATYRGVGIFFVVAALVAAGFGYLGLQTDVRETDATGHPVGDSLVEGASGAMTVTAGWVAVGIAVLCGAVAIACFVRAAR